MRACIIWSWVGVASLLFAGGCTAPRYSEPTVEPTFSYLRDEPAQTQREIWPVLPAPLADKPADSAWQEPAMR